MLKNRSLQVKMIKDAEVPTDAYILEGPTFEEKVEIIGEQVKNFLMMVGAGMLAYVVADTYRQVTIENARK